MSGYLDGLDASFISADESVAAESVRHLAGLGHVRVGFAAGPRRYLSTQRKIEGYLRGLRSAVPTADESLVAETVYSVEGGHLAMTRLLEDGVTAVLMGSDLMGARRRPGRPRARPRRAG